MSNRLVNAFLKAGIHAGTFYLAYWCVVWFGSHSPSRAAYGLISGWWATLYIGYVASIGLFSGIIVATGYVILGIVAVYSQWHWFYAGLPDRLDVGFLLYPITISAVACASPTLVNLAVRGLVRAIRRQRQGAR